MANTEAQKFADAKYRAKKLMPKLLALLAPTANAPEGEVASAKAKIEEFVVKFGFNVADFVMTPHTAKPQPQPQPKKAAPKAKPAKAAMGKRRGPEPEFKDDQIITMVVTPNPKREGSMARGRFAKYRKGMTIAEALKAGLRREDFKWDTDHGFIAIE